ncbi:putative dna replication licensing factor mcm5 protein [Lasiodiplodia theobromae]|nr:putative dna replication licensing factor mcm5 protein [Lasiodiplodia theobromae]
MRFTVTAALLATAVRTVYEFPGSWIENIAVRDNGNLLLTFLLPEPDLVELCNPASHSPTPRLIHRFDPFPGLTGITETSPDVFAVIAGNAPDIDNPYYSLWEADLTCDDEPKITPLIKHFREGCLLNGMTTLSPASRHSDCNDAVVLISDSAGGVVLRVDLASKKVSTFLYDPHITQAPPPANASAVPFGVNGLRYRPQDGYLYFTSTDRRLLARVRADPDDKTAAGPIDVLNAGGVAADDFAVREEGELPTSAQFGRTERDRDTLYVVTRDAKVFAIGGF